MTIKEADASAPVIHATTLPFGRKPLGADVRPDWSSLKSAHPPRAAATRTSWHTHFVPGTNSCTAASTQ
jgi:hypothetical protein